MKKSILIGGLLISCFAVSTTNSVLGQQKSTGTNEQPNGFTLSDQDKKVLCLRIKYVLELDQQFRSYMSWNTLDDAEIERLGKLELKEAMVAMKANEGKLDNNTMRLLETLQKKNDRRNQEEFIEIVKQYGYPSPERLGVESDDLFPILLHPPVDRDQIEAHMKEMIALLRPEVTSGRMNPKFFAMFVDNMLGKILRRPQLYGTNQVFNPQTNSIEGPIIADIEATNQARREIGLPELKEGEYRISAEGKSN